MCLSVFVCMCVCVPLLLPLLLWIFLKYLLWVFGCAFWFVFIFYFFKFDSFYKSLVFCPALDRLLAHVASRCMCVCVGGWGPLSVRACALAGSPALFGLFGSTVLHCGHERNRKEVFLFFYQLQCDCRLLQMCVFVQKSIPRAAIIAVDLNLKYAKQH